MQLRPVSSVEIRPGVLITLSDLMTSVREKLGAVTSIPVISGTPLMRYSYPEYGIEFLATRRVIAIFLRGSNAPTLRIQRAGQGADVSTLRIGMTAKAVGDLLRERPFPVQLTVPNVDYYFYAGAGVAIRYDANNV